MNGMSLIALLKRLRTLGLEIIARVDNQPSWARGDRLFPGSGPPDDLDDWRIFLERLAARYKGRIQAYQIWNEPNLDREWGNRAPNAEEYVELLRVAHQAIKKLRPGRSCYLRRLVSHNRGQRARASGRCVHARNVRRRAQGGN